MFKFVAFQLTIFVVQVRNPSAVKMPENSNGKYRSIEFGRTRLADRLKRANRMAPTVIKVTRGGVTNDLDINDNLLTTSVVILP